MTPPWVLILALWVVWVLGWMAAALATAPTLVRQSPLSLLAHRLPMWVGGVLMFVHVGGDGGLFRPLVPYAWLAWAGVALVALGLGFSAWARVHLGRLWSGNVTLKTGHRIVRSGPYSLARHPIYTGLLLALLGTALARGTVAALLGLAFMWLGGLIKIRQEERLLLEYFGDDYRAYQREVPALVPRPWRAVR
jgi:protein-S-isoprenylcysteine O-methyltransferase Ste14